MCDCLFACTKQVLHIYIRISVYPRNNVPQGFSFLEGRMFFKLGYQFCHVSPVSLHSWRHCLFVLLTSCKHSVCNSPALHNCIIVRAHIVQQAFWCSVMPLPWVSPAVLFKDCMRYCSITKSETRPAQYWLMRLMTWNPFINSWKTFGFCFSKYFIFWR